MQRRGCLHREREFATGQWDVVDAFSVREAAVREGVDSASVLPGG